LLRCSTVRATSVRSTRKYFFRKLDGARKLSPEARIRLFVHNTSARHSAILNNFVNLLD